MAFSIYTYSNPYEINAEPYWDSIKNCAHFCVSQTMVNGMVATYEEFSWGKLSTVENLVKSLYELWESTECKIKQYTVIDNIINRVNFKENENADKIRKGLGFNKKRIVDSIRIMIELGMNISEMKLSVMTQEQKYIVGIFNEIFKTNDLEIFTLKDNFTENEINNAIVLAMKAENEDLDETFVDTNTVIIHGIHQFTPIILKAIEAVSKYKRVVLMFNYQKQYKNVYQTWIDVYSAFDIPIKSQFSNEFKPNPLIANSYDGNMLADKLATLIEGKYVYSEKDVNYEIIEFNNVTEFAGYVADIYEKACMEQEKDKNKRRSALYYMNEQFYSANNSVNDILKVYYPEQFGERHFLAYPIGHFFMSVTNMWNPDKGGICIEDMNDIVECLSAGIIIESVPGQLVSIFNKTKVFFHRSKSLEEIKDLLKKLKKRINKALSQEDEKQIGLRISYFNVSMEEIDLLDDALVQLDEITRFFYEDFENKENNFRNFYIKIRDFLKARVYEAEDLEDEFRDIITRVLARLEDADKFEANGSFECLKDTMTFYLKQESKKGRSANWIVRDFEQIDGDILKSRWQKPDIVYHFACLSDEEMCVTHNDRFPWPLDVNFFELAQEPIDWKYQVFIKSRREYKNFKRYALIYGLQFNRVKFKLSYVKNVDDKENEMFYLLKILGVNKKYNILTDKNNVLADSSFIKIQGTNEIEFNLNDLYKSRICKYRFMLESLIENGTKYKDRFLFLKYFEILLENKVRVKLQGQPATEDIIMQALLQEFETLRRKFEFAIDLDKMDIIMNARNFLKNEVLKDAKTFPNISENDKSYMQKKEEFIYLKIGAKDNPDENILKYKFRDALQSEIKTTLSTEKLKEMSYVKEVDEWCKYCPNREICLETYKQIKD